MDTLIKKKYDEFYVAYFDQRGNIIYPSDINEVKIIKEMIKNISENNIVYTDDGKRCYKLRIKRSQINGSKVQVVELSNITEYMHQISTASVDDITHLNTRKIARNYFIEYIEQAYKNGEDFAIAIADIDYFKEVNDTYGHTNGDIVLSEISRIMYCSTRQASYRPQDIVARIGGDEFVIILKNVTKDLAYKRVEQIRSDVENHQVTLFTESDVSTFLSAGTLSMGLYHITYEELTVFFEKGYSIDEIRRILIDRCDSALYESKNNGKNQTTIYCPDNSYKLE